MSKHKVVHPKNLPSRGTLLWLWCWAISCKLWDFSETVQAVGYTLITLMAVIQIWYLITHIDYVDLFKEP